MKEYIKFVADRILLELGYSKIWNIKDPEGKIHTTNNLKYFCNL